MVAPFSDRPQPPVGGYPTRGLLVALALRRPVLLDQRGRECSHKHVLDLGAQGRRLGVPASGDRPALEPSDPVEEAHDVAVGLWAYGARGRLDRPVFQDLDLQLVGRAIHRLTLQSSRHSTPAWVLACASSRVRRPPSCWPTSTPTV